MRGKRIPAKHDGDALGVVARFYSLPNKAAGVSIPISRMLPTPPGAATPFPFTFPVIVSTVNCQSSLLH
nr:hypothetical protein Iba_chr11bCG18270 [Ipomoea batatas]GMD53139.1 hypothetical protein Iba_chr11bCG18280 [Ipomoea batatas]